MSCHTPFSPTDDGIALEGPDFRKMPEEELLPLLPRLQVGMQGEGRGVHQAAAAELWRCLHALPACQWLPTHRYW